MKDKKQKGDERDRHLDEGGVIQGLDDVSVDTNKTDPYKNPIHETYEAEEKQKAEEELIELYRIHLSHLDPGLDTGAHTPHTRLEDSKVEAIRVARIHRAFLEMRDKEIYNRSFQWLRRQPLLKKTGVNENVFDLKLVLELFRSRVGLEEGDKFFRIFMEVFSGKTISVPSKERQTRARIRASVRTKIEDYNQRMEVWKESMKEPEQTVLDGEVTTTTPEGTVTVEPSKPRGHTLTKKQKALLEAQRPKKPHSKGVAVEYGITDQEARDIWKEEEKFMQEQRTPEEIELEDEKFSVELLKLFEAIKNVDLPGHLKQSFDRKRKDTRQLTIEAMKDQIEALRKRGMPEEEIEARFRRQNEILKQEQEQNLKQFEDSVKSPS